MTSNPPPAAVDRAVAEAKASEGYAQQARKDAEAKLALRTLPAPVSVTRIEEAAAEIESSAWNTGTVPTIESIRAILRKHTATADVEGLARALKADWEREFGVPYETKWPLHTHRHASLARAALAYLGVEAKPAEPRAGFVADMKKLARAIDDAVGNYSNTPEAKRAADGALVEIERQQAEWQKGGAK